MKDTFEQIRVEFKEEENGAGKPSMCLWRRDDQSLGEDMV